MELTLTQPDSDIQVIFNANAGYFLLEFVFDQQINWELRQIDGNDFGNVVEKKWTIPQSQLKELNRRLSHKINWKTPEQMATQKRDLSMNEETLADVLSRIPKITDTPYMKINPYDFQKVAIGWASTPKGVRGNIYGGLLADLMGLGKTIEALAISGHLKHLGLIKNALIVCPATLKMQWSQEIQKFTHESSIIIDGDKKKREKQFNMVRELNPFYTIINYELLYSREILDRKPVGRKPRNENEKQKTKIIYGDYNVVNQILNIEYDMIIIDEAHRMKNPDTLSATCIRMIQPQYKLLMTGTPIAKDLKNIFQLLDYLSPNILSSDDLDFETRRQLFEERFLVMGWNPFNKWEKERMVIREKNVDVLRNLLAPYQLRRTPEDVSDDMPAEEIRSVVVNWDDAQKSLYNSFQEELKNNEERRSEAKTKEDTEKLNNEVNQMLLYMHETCDSPELLLMGNVALAKKKLGKSKNFPNPPKLTRLVEMVEEILTDSDEKVVIFSKFERMTKIIQRELDELSISMAKSKGKPKGSREYEIKMYTGDTPKGCKWKNEIEKKGEIAKDLQCNTCPFINSCNSRTKSAWFFQNDPDTRVIILTDAGNFGVNLQSGRYLINYDLPDSHSIYSQRNGRVRRLGSKYKQVYIYNLVVGGTIDESKLHKIMKQMEVAGWVIENDELDEEAIRKATEMMNEELLAEILHK